ncbi:unnamed protein product [Phytophthora fragariaefolia]|uniref:Unnamed protein product n=1 Tax=Phytophthora fragariaefolia TaxID=1490495 RepID=A0A9W6X8Z1_9STRA|nr:unnamed protein product [Phytophthora fragariaefolia]
MHQQQEQQQRREGSEGPPRRSLASSFTAQAGGYQQQQQTSFLQYSMPMEPSIRSYNQQQQQISGRYWQPPPGVEASTSSYGKQRQHVASLGLGEFDMLDASAVRSGGDAAAAPSEAASEMSMASFDVHSFQDGSAGAAGGSGMDTTGFQPTAGAASMQSTEQGSAAPTRVAPASDDLKTRALVDAAYAPFSQLPDEPDLKTERLPKDKNARCQFDGCPNRARVSQAYGNFCNRHVIVSPCGFPGCRDKTMDSAAMCARHMQLGKQALQTILDARTQNVPVCKRAGCFKNDQGRGYCRGHEKLLMATGRLPAHINKRRLNSAYTMCSYPECNKHSQRHHLCRTHGNLIVKQAQELADRPGATESYEEILARMQKNIRRCTHENCTKNSQRDRLCTMHYNEKHDLQRDGSTPPNTASSGHDNTSSSQPETGNCGASDIRAVERTRCEKSNCVNLSYAAGLCVEHAKQHQNLIQGRGRYDDPFSSDSNSGIFSTEMENETKQDLFTQHEKAQAITTSTSASTATLTNIAHTKCMNLVCDRESYGREFCEACQKLFSPLVVAINEDTAHSSGYPFNSSTTAMDQAEVKAFQCRVSNCEQDCVRGGLCATHLRAFKTGLLSVDNLKLDSQAQQERHEQELAEAAAVAAAAVEAKPASPPASGKSRKYYCKVDGCDKQAQKRNLCKRHFRLQEGTSAGKPQPEIRLSGPSRSYVPPAQQSEFSQPTIACRFPGCSQIACGGSLLCLTHSKATFCWQPGCETLVDHPRFCEFHAFRQQCAYEGCMYTAERNSSGCMNHAMARRCRHEFCGKFAVGSNSDWCRLHQISCQDSPCALCRLHMLSLDGLTTCENENSNRSRSDASASVSRGMPGGVHGFGGGSPFGRNPRLM